jgi:prepilin-type processing-associated H-X9-DG protein
VPRAQSHDDPPGVLGECRCFLCPNNPGRSTPDRPGLTHYVGISGLGPEAASLPLGYPRAGLTHVRAGVFGHDRKLTCKEIADGTATTLLLAETAVDNGPWTAGGRPTVRGLDPSGLPFLGEGGQFGGTHRGGAMVAFADGSVRFLRSSVAPSTFEALATIAGGETIGALE